MRMVIKLRNPSVLTINKQHVEIDCLVVAFVCKNTWGGKKKMDECDPSHGLGGEANFGVLFFFGMVLGHNNQSVISSYILIHL